MRRAVERSRVVGAVREGREILSHWASEARSVGVLAVAGETLSDAGATAGRWARSSWLLGPPAEPEVVVIDLRETYTVGPLLAGLDRLAAALGPAWRDSPPRRGLHRAGAVVADRPVRVGSLLLLAVIVGSLLPSLAAGDGVGGWHLIAAGFALLGTRERRSARQLGETVVGRAVAALLVPPEPPGAER